MTQDKDLKAKNIKTVIMLAILALTVYGIYIVTTALAG